jgi:hypothetical protein
MALLTAKNDEDAMEQAKDLLRTHAYRHYKLSAVEKHEPIKMKMKEDVEVQVDKAGDKVTTDMLRGREQGGNSNEFKSVKLQLKTDGEMKAPSVKEPNSTAARTSIDTTDNSDVTPKFDAKLGHPTPQEHFTKEDSADSWKKETPWMKSPGKVTDKSGAKHTPMSRAKDLARQAFKKLKKETVMGKISN